MFLSKDNATIENIRISDAATFLSVSNATIRNWIKTGLLESPSRGYISVKSLEHVKHNLIGDSKLTSRANKSFKSHEDRELSHFSIEKELNNDAWNDNIGRKYETSLTESHRNKEGIYYTDESIVADMMKDVKISRQTTFLDPCCGSGNFIIQAIDKGVRVENIYGFDTDPVAVEITRRRIYHRTGVWSDHIVCADYLSVAGSLKKKFDLIYTNPPWGKKLPKSRKEELSLFYNTGKSKDSSSLFVFASVRLLTRGGSLGFLLPESVLNIATFQSLRELFLSLSIQEIKNYGKAFEGIQSRAYSIIVEQLSPRENHQVRCVEEESHFRLQSSFSKNPNRILNVWTTNEEQQVVNRLLELPHYSLKGNADWGLGIVTGDNKNKCKSQLEDGLVPVYRGKDINPDKLNPPTKYIDPDLSQYQQTASPSVYYAEKKIIYRFISDRLVFFCDTEQILILNSANALVLRRDFPISSEQLVSFLNSRIMSWLFNRVFRTHKVLRKDLEVLPIFTFGYIGDLFNEERFLIKSKIIYTNGTFSIEG
ncbi:MAG: TaqI-like C-terminal specificity domain-containing protein [Porphyromonas sp.]|nr:TaqI-like C-terminal specificity domain-containing protein [Porphyromonas sp.]